MPTSDRDSTFSAGAAESPASFDFASKLFSNVRYATPMAAIREPPDKLFGFISICTPGRFFPTYISVKSSTFIAGSRVKVLIVRQAAIHVAVMEIFLFKNVVP
jgi:hypothetical protein